MPSMDRRLQQLEEKAVQHRGQRAYEAGALDRINARLDAIGQRLRSAGVAFDVDAVEVAQRMAAAKARLQLGKV